MAENNKVAILMGKIKPCPFCGCTEIEIASDDRYYNTHAGNGFMHFYCPDCKLDAWNFPDKDMPYEEAVELMLEKWNRRAQV